MDIYNDLSFDEIKLLDEAMVLFYLRNEPVHLFDGEFTNIYPDGIGVKVSNGEIVITSLQPEGKQRMDATTYINGIQDKEEFLKGVLK